MASRRAAARPVPRVRQVLQPAWRAAWQAAVLTAVALLVTRAVFRALPPGPVLGLAALATTTVQVLRRLPATALPTAVPRPPAATGTVLVRVGTGQVDRALDALPAFDRHLRSRLVRLTDDRLLRHHGVDRTRRPEQARRLVGADLWQLLEQPVTALPGRAAVAALLDTIEAL